MIRINLLGDETVIDNSGKYILAGYGASVLLCLVVFFSMYTSAGSNIDDLTSDVDIRQAQLEKLKKQTKVAKDLENKRDLLNQKLAVIARLKKSKLGPVRVLDDLNLSLPDRAWLASVSEANGKVTISGKALDNQTVASFMRKLEDSDYFKNVDLVESNQKYLLSRTGEIFSQLPRRKSEAGRGGSSSSLPDHWVRIKDFKVRAQVLYSGKILAAGVAGGRGASKGKPGKKGKKA